MKKKMNRFLHGRLVVWILSLFLLANLPLNQILAQEMVDVSGTVTDADADSPLPGVTVVVVGTTTGTISDIDGKFSLTVPADAELEFGFIGYLTEKVSVNNQTEISVNMVADIIGLDEVIVTGYGVQKKSDITGSIASVSGEKLVETPVPNVDQALQGLAAGVNVIPVSGRPGEEAVIQIRGISSINGIEPLVIVDGVPGDLSDVTPSDIESIEVLKDASSAAIYGDSGGNGVILITTKKGKAGKMKTTFNLYLGRENAVSNIDLMDSEQWLETANESRASTEAISSRPDTFPNYNWQEIMFEPALTQNYDLSFSGGSEKSSYLISGSYNNQEGIIRSSNYERFSFRVNSEHKINKRVTFTEKISYININRFGLPDWQWNAYYDGPVRSGLIMQPNVPDYNPDGSWANSEFGGNNPLAMLDMVDRVQKTNNFNGVFALKIDIVKGLSFTSKFGGGLGFWDNKEYQNSYENTVVDFRNDDEVKIIAGIGRSFDYTAQQLLNYDVSIADVHNISVMVGLENTRYWGYDYGGERYMPPNQPDNLQYFSQSVNDTAINQIIDGSGYEGRGMAYLGRINYDYKGKYLLTVNARYSGRSSFGPDNRFGFFPSFSAGWKFSEESFMENQNIISFGKVRFGYGEVGTYGRSGTPYLSIVRSPLTFGYPVNAQVSTPGAAPVQIANPEIRWETIHMTNIGIDLGMFQNRLSITAEYYSKVNEDMLMLQEVPYIAGTYSLGSAYDIDETSPEVNIGSIKNSGFEFTIGYKDQRGDFKYSVDANFSTVKNEILSLASDSLYGGAVHNVNPLTITRVGGSVSEFYGYKTDGLFTRDDCAVDANGDYLTDIRGRYIIKNQPFFVNNAGDTTFAQPTAQPGDVRYVDLNGDGRVLTPDDKTSLGSPLPKLIFGFSLNMEYKGFDFIAQFYGTVGNKIFNGTKQYLYYQQELTNHAVEFGNRYVDADIYKDDPYTGEPVLVVPQNQNTTVARNATDNYVHPRDFYIENGSYLRLRNLTLGYTLPSNITNVVNIERLRVYVGGRNLLTWTSYQGLNPEIGQQGDEGLLSMGIDASIYPVTKMWYFGVNLSF